MEFFLLIRPSKSQKSLPHPTGEDKHARFLGPPVFRLSYRLDEIWSFRRGFSQRDVKVCLQNCARTSVN